MGRPARPIDERLWERVDKTSHPDGCWIWLGSFNTYGYGQMMIGSRLDGSRTLAVTHRLAYQVTKGAIDSKLEIDHLCRNRKCCNPDHLEAVPHSVNVNRAVAGSDYLCINGHPKTYVTKRKRFHCAICGRAAQRRWRDKSKVA
jgi:hypothetical protein